jgi:hypothetical protein
MPFYTQSKDVMHVISMSSSAWLLEKSDTAHVAVCHDAVLLQREQPRVSLDCKQPSPVSFFSWKAHFESLCDFSHTVSCFLRERERERERERGREALRKHGLPRALHIVRR